MYIVHVSFHVKEDRILDFKAATENNVKNSLKESGVDDFSLLQQQDDTSRFLMIEVYKSPDDQLKHRETEHYKKWRETVTDMFAEPYSFIKYDNAF